MRDDGFDKLIFYGGLALVAYILWKKFNPFDPSTPTASAGGGFIQSLVNPLAANYTPGQSWKVVFPDGTSHAVDPAGIAADGTITWTDGQVYTIYTGIQGHAAVLNSSLVSTQAPGQDFAAQYPGGA